MRLDEILLLVLIVIVIWYYYKHTEEVNKNLKTMFRLDTEAAPENYSVGGWNTLEGWRQITGSAPATKENMETGGSMSYEDELIASSIGSDIKASHSAFVKDRTQFDTATGPLKKISLEPQESVSWMGLRRPRPVSVDPNSAQIHDVDMDAYSGGGLRY